MRYILKIKSLLIAVVSLACAFFPVGVAGAQAKSIASGTKPVPQPPVIHNLTAKPQHSKAEAIRPFGGNGFAINLSATPQNLWQTEYSTITATTNADVRPTPYYISVYDQTAHTELAVCGAGTRCSAAVTQQTATTHSYQAYVGDYPSYNSPPGFILVASPTVAVTWQGGISITLSASQTTLALGGATTLTSTTSSDVGPTPFFNEIFDATTGTRLNTCGSGISCSATTSQATATTHKFVAYISGGDATYPPGNIEATSVANYITWSNAGYNLSLRVGSGQTTVVATSNIDVEPTPYYIEIFNLTTGTRVAVCGSGTSCTATAPTDSRNYFVAFISTYDGTLPPADTQASSNVVTNYF